jgi:6,7-dimethyl-8-ribityllumazine synthase
VVVLGAVAQGETKHDELVVNTMTEAIVQLSLTYNKPVGFGVIGPGAKHMHFKDRTEEYGRRAVQAVICNLDLLRSK